MLDSINFSVGDLNSGKISENALKISSAGFFIINISSTFLKEASSRFASSKNSSNFVASEISFASCWERPIGNLNTSLVSISLNTLLICSWAAFAPPVIIFIVSFLRSLKNFKYFALFLYKRYWSKNSEIGCFVSVSPVFFKLSKLSSKYWTAPFKLFWIFSGKVKKTSSIMSTSNKSVNLDFTVSNVWLSLAAVSFILWIPFSIIIIFLISPRLAKIVFATSKDLICDQRSLYLWIFSSEESTIFSILTSILENISSIVLTPTRFIFFNFSNNCIIITFAAESFFSTEAEEVSILSNAEVKLYIVSLDKFEKTVLIETPKLSNFDFNVSSERLFGKFWRSCSNFIICWEVFAIASKFPVLTASSCKIFNVSNFKEISIQSSNAFLDCKTSLGNSCPNVFLRISNLSFKETTESVVFSACNSKDNKTFLSRFVTSTLFLEISILCSSVKVWSFNCCWYSPNKTIVDAIFSFSLFSTNFKVGIDNFGKSNSLKISFKIKTSFEITVFNSLKNFM